MKKKTFSVLICALLLVTAAAFVIACGNNFSVVVVGGEGSGNYAAGEQCTITAATVEGMAFKNWTTADGAVLSDKSPYTFTVEKDMAITANYSAQYKITVEGGTASKANVVDGTDVKITATVPAGKEFDEWQVAGVTLSKENPYTFKPIASMTITAKFKDKQLYTITVTDGVGGGSYYGGDKVGVVANKAAGTFVNWTKNGVEVSKDLNYVFTASESVALVANYATKTQFATPTNKLFAAEAPDGTQKNIAMDRMYSAPNTIFTNGSFTGGASIDFVLVAIYDSKTGSTPVEYITYYQNTSKNLNGEAEITQTQEWSRPGNYYFFGGDFGAFLTEVMGDRFDPMTDYFFKSQLIAKTTSNYSNSDFSPVCDLGYSLVFGDFYRVVLENCTAPGGRYPDGQEHSTSVKVGESITATANPKEGQTFVKWQVDGVDVAGAAGTASTYTFTPTKACKVTAVMS